MPAVQAPPPALTVSVSPRRAPSSSARLKFAVTDKAANAREVVVYFPKGIAISNAGIADGAKAGTGSITVDEQDTDLAPTVTAKGLAFAAGEEILDGVFSQASGRYTAKLRVKVPQPLRAFTALSLNLKVKSLFSVRACPLPFRVDLVGAKKTVLTADAPCKG
jgi:hypothetical protein